MVEKYEITELSEDRLTPFLSLFIPGFYSKGTFVADFAEPNMTKIDQWAQGISEAMKADGGYLSKGENLPAIFNTALKIANIIEKLVGKKISGIIQEAGTKKQGEYYLDKDNFGIFYCKTESTTIINDPAIFEDYSNFEIRKKLKETIEELNKIASPTQLGRIKLGKGMTLKEGGIVDVENADISGKLDKGAVSEDYNTAKKIEDKIKENEEKFKNFCPFPVNSLFLSLDNSNPATLFLGTTWEKQEGRFLLGSSSTYLLGSTGGSATTTLNKANLPAVKLQLDSFNLGRGTMEITGTLADVRTNFAIGSGAFNYTSTSSIAPGVGGAAEKAYKVDFAASRTWTGMSTSAAPFTTNMGSGEAFNNMPPYLVVNICKRLT